MAGDDEKLTGLEELLTEAVPEAVSIVRQLLSFGNEAEIRLAEIRLEAAKTLLDTWSRIKELQARPYRVVEPSQAVVAVNGAAARTENADQLLTEIMENEQISESPWAGDEDLPASNGSANAALARAKAPPVKPAAARNGPAPAKPAAPAAKPKPASELDEDAGPGVPVKYWITLGVLTLVCATYFIWQWQSSRIPTPEELLQIALKGGDADARSRAAASLCINVDPASKVALRKLAAETQDAAAKELALQALADRSDAESMALFLDAMESSDKALRALGYKAIRKMLAIPEQKDIGYDPEGSQDRNAAAMRELREQHRKSQIVHPYNPNPYGVK